jgi:hypothetical protein
MEPLYALTSQQHADIGHVVRSSRNRVRSQVNVGRGDGRQRVARVMNDGAEFPIYDSIAERDAALFELSRSTDQDTLQFFGSDLQGLVRLTIGSISIEIDCRATTDELRAALGLDVSICRVTAFPGLWEFAWQLGMVPQTITCVPVPAAEDIYCTAGIVQRREGWRSVSADGANVSRVKVLDCIPFLEGELKRGAMAMAFPLGDTLYAAGVWSCPGVTYRIQN